VPALPRRRGPGDLGVLQAMITHMERCGHRNTVGDIVGLSTVDQVT
jgi:hypothetical protein